LQSDFVQGVVAVNSQKITRERQKLMISMLEKKIRLRAQQLYDQRGKTEGRALEDWVTAESEVLKSSILAPLWNVRGGLQSTEV
jgi:hypothetical protein